jgi:hypothetical protein
MQELKDQKGNIIAYLLAPDERNSLLNQRPNLDFAERLYIKTVKAIYNENISHVQLALVGNDGNIPITKFKPGETVYVIKENK